MEGDVRYSAPADRDSPRLILPRGLYEKRFLGGGYQGQTVERAIGYIPSYQEYSQFMPKYLDIIKERGRWQPWYIAYAGEKQLTLPERRTPKQYTGTLIEQVEASKRQATNVQGGSKMVVSNYTRGTLGRTPVARSAQPSRLTVSSNGNGDSRRLGAGALVLISIILLIMGRKI